MHTFLVRDTCPFLRLLVIFYSQMQELRTTFFWLLIASHLALFKRMLQTTALYIHTYHQIAAEFCFQNKIGTVQLQNSSDKIQLCWALSEFHSNKNTSVFHVDSCLLFKWCCKDIKRQSSFKAFWILFYLLFVYSKKTIQLLKTIRPFLMIS